MHVRGKKNYSINQTFASLFQFFFSKLTRNEFDDKNNVQTVYN